MIWVFVCLNGRSKVIKAFYDGVKCKDYAVRYMADTFFDDYDYKGYSQDTGFEEYLDHCISYLQKRCAKDGDYPDLHFTVKHLDIEDRD